MTKPNIAGLGSIKVTLEIHKKYNYCTCGNSNNQPFCDGSHKNTQFSPLTFIAEKPEARLCLCKHSKNLPFCDGSHKELPGYVAPTSSPNSTESGNSTNSTSEN